MVHADASRQAELWDAWAHQHRDLYPDKDPAPAVDFLSALCGSGATALELGAGSGRVASPLARRGVRVSALEISAVLAQRMREQSPQLHVVEADMADFSLGSYDLIYAVHSSFFHLTEQSRQVDCMMRVREHLAPGGAFVLSCYVPDPESILREKNLQLTTWSGDAVVLRATTVDRNAQQIQYREVELGAAGSAVLAAEQRYCWPAELDLMARLAGLALSDRCEDFSGARFDNESRRHVSVYRSA